jgi:hypothetical protein
LTVSVLCPIVSLIENHTETLYSNDRLIILYTHPSKYRIKYNIFNTSKEALIHYFWDKKAFNKLATKLLIGEM